MLPELMVSTLKGGGPPYTPISNDKNFSGWEVVVHAFNSITQKAEVCVCGGEISVSLKSTWSKE